MTDDRIRISDADRERVAARLREHFAEGRLSSDQLDERIAAALSAKTFGDVRRIMAGLPDPVPVPPQARQSPPGATGHGAVSRGRPRIVPLAVFALTAALVIPGAARLFLGVRATHRGALAGGLPGGDLRGGPAPPAHPPLLAIR